MVDANFGYVTVDSAPLELLNTFVLARGRVTGP
jgi:hypothetical protein